MFQSRHIDVSSDLAYVSIVVENSQGVWDVSYILLYIFLTLFDCCLSKLSSYLSRRVVHELPIHSKDVTIAASASLLLIRISSVTLLGLR